eukprot:Skav211617  [mRNA]  locus=scaffold3083:364631:366254:- [translate_table: standard]
MATLELHASLPSGRCESFLVQQSGTVGDLKKAVQKSLGQPFLRLAAPDGRLLDDPSESVESVGLQGGDTIAAVVQQPKIRVAATRRAFAMWCDNGDRVLTWGDPLRGGDSSEVQHQLQNVRQVHSTASPLQYRLVLLGTRTL